MSVISRIRRRIHSTTEVAPDVYQLAIRGVNVFLIVEEKLTLIDTGLRGSTNQITDIIRHLGRSPEEISLIILTHNHIDHLGGLARLKQLTQARVAIHKTDIGIRKDLPSDSGVKHWLPLPKVTSSLRSVFSVKISDVDIQLEGGEVLEPLGGLAVIHTPGHTPGSISLFSPQHKLLIVGDAMRKRHKTIRMPPKMASSDLTQALESVKKLARLDFNTICFGHGLPVSDDVHTRLQDLLERNKD
ncbi:MBL fold metallo-hydrolase [Chloroflexota bacterium]